MSAQDDKATKSLDPDEPYVYAPPKDDDPWLTVLTPELEADTMRCSAWKDEVQNLLIFAGLFSAVVTAFVVESYKFLQPDPNDTMVGLLFRIANGLNSTSPLPPGSMPTPFLRTPSSIRINVFWFISLVLSLTTVLAGTVALQWLREHQNYVGYSSKEKVAILHMRKQAVDAWYLPQMFAFLPLLLQAAVVLFLGGLIDFALSLDPKLAVSVSVVIGLALLFLATTSALPVLQSFSFFCHLYPRQTVPIPCPYKSPQSHALRMLYGIAIRAILHVFPPPTLKFDAGSYQKGIRKYKTINPSMFVPHHLAPSVYNLWERYNWHTFDREWIALRDACHQRILDKDSDLYQHRIVLKDVFPISDVTQYLVDAINYTPGMKRADSFLAAAVHCFHQISESIWTVLPVSYVADLHQRDRHNNYLDKLYKRPQDSCSMSAYFRVIHGTYKFDRYSPLVTKILQRLCCDDQTLVFLHNVLHNHSVPPLAHYQLELWSRIIQFSAYALKNDTSSTYFRPMSGVVSTRISPPANPTIFSSQILSSLTSYEFAGDRIYPLMIADIVGTILKQAASNDNQQGQSMNPFYAHSSMAYVFNRLASATSNYLRLAQKDFLTKRPVLRDIDDRFVQVFNFITDHLTEDLISQNSESLNIFFYLSSMFTSELMYWSSVQKALAMETSNFGQSLRSLLSALLRTWSKSSRRRNHAIEQLLEEDYHKERFSDHWYHEIFKHIPEGIAFIDWSKTHDYTDEATYASPLNPLSPYSHLGSSLVSPYSRIQFSEHEFSVHDYADNSAPSAPYVPSLPVMTDDQLEDSMNEASSPILPIYHPLPSHWRTPRPEFLDEPIFGVHDYVEDNPPPSPYIPILPVTPIEEATGNDPLLEASSVASSDGPSETYYDLGAEYHEEGAPPVPQHLTPPASNTTNLPESNPPPLYYVTFNYIIGNLNLGDWLRR